MGENPWQGLIPLDHDPDDGLIAEPHGNLALGVDPASAVMGYAVKDHRQGVGRNIINAALQPEQARVTPAQADQAGRESGAFAEANFIIDANGHGLIIITDSPIQ